MERKKRSGSLSAQPKAEYLKFQFLHENLNLFRAFMKTRRSNKIKIEVSTPDCILGPELRPERRFKDLATSEISHVSITFNQTNVLFPL